LNWRPRLVTVRIVHEHLMTSGKGFTVTLELLMAFNEAILVGTDLDDGVVPGT
jgi:hypothetical protein